jgi:hypothetical protein
MENVIELYSFEEVIDFWELKSGSKDLDRSKILPHSHYHTTDITNQSRYLQSIYGLTFFFVTMFLTPVFKCIMN